jgi:hypothetical protein
MESLHMGLSLRKQMSESAAGVQELNLNTRELLCMQGICRIKSSIFEEMTLKQTRRLLETRRQKSIQQLSGVSTKPVFLI